MSTNADKINAWRDAHPSERLNERTLLGLLALDTLEGADLRGADLWGADLRYANVEGADLPGLFYVSGLPSGQVILLPTADGWVLLVGCWRGTVSDLRDLIATNDGWPEARGDECDRRRPGLEAVIALCEANIAAHPDLVSELAKKWSNQ